MNRTDDLKTKLNSIVEMIRQLSQTEQKNVHTAKQLEENPQMAAQEQLADFTQREKQAVGQLRTIYDSIGDVLNELKAASHPNKEQLLDHLQMSYHMSGELLQQESINVTTGSTVANDPFLQTGQVFSSVDRLERYAADELKALENRLSAVARGL